MTNYFKILFLSVSLMTFALGFAQAETIQGYVVAVDSPSNTVTMQLTDEKTGAERGKSITLELSPDADLSGISSLDALEAGDEIRVDATEMMVFGKLKVLRRLLYLKLMNR